MGLVEGLLRGDRRNAALIVFDFVEADPSRETLLAAADCRTLGLVVASVVGFGGGSPMDVAKLARPTFSVRATRSMKSGVSASLRDALPVASSRPPRTGSEATPISVITCDGGSSSRSIRRADRRLGGARRDFDLGLPRTSGPRPGSTRSFTRSRPYVGEAQEPAVGRAGARSSRLLNGNLIKVIGPADLEARSAMLLGAHLAGLAFSTAPVAGVHALAYPLGGLHHLPHGLSNALMLRHVLARISRPLAITMPSSRKSSSPLRGLGTRRAPRC